MGAVPLNTDPSDRVPLIVPVPFVVMVKLMLPPLHMVAVPLRTPVCIVSPSNSSAPTSGAEPVPIYPGFPCLVCAS